MTSPAKSIGELIEPLLTSSGLELWDVEQVRGAVRVYVDRPGGVDLDTLGRFARAISAVLDAENAVPGGPYQLEVSSPGVERTLREPAHYQRFIGSLVAVKTVAAVGGSRRFQGQLLAADETGITIGFSDAESQKLTYGHVQKARTVWAPATSPGSSPTERVGQWPHVGTAAAGRRPPRRGAGSVKSLESRKGAS